MEFLEKVISFWSSYTEKKMYVRYDYIFIVKYYSTLYYNIYLLVLGMFDSLERIDSWDDPRLNRWE